MKISNLIFLGFLLILILFSLTTYINFKQTEKVNENSEFFANSTYIVRESNRFQRNILNMISGLRGYLFTGENYFIEAYDSAANENVKILTELSTIIPDTSQQYKKLELIHTLNDEWVKAYAAPLIAAKRVALVADSGQAAFNSLYREKLSSGSEQALNRRLQQIFRDFSNYEYNLRDRRKAELTNSIRKTRQISFYLTTLSIVIGIAIAAFVAHRISTRIIRMVHMADKIAAGNYSATTEEKGRDELSLLAKSLNHMSKVLSENINLLQRKNEELGQFAHIVSHDLKAPLRGIDNVIAWIEEDHSHELTPKLKEYIHLIKGRLFRAERMIQGILLYARVGREMPVKEEVDLNVLLQETVDSVGTNPKHKVEVQADLPVIKTERIPLQQVLSNLISNAIKYHDKDDGSVRVSFKDLGTHYRFIVEDNGPGIDKSY
ncbi:MAG TPA: CHASE3 domain-containing protein, partial [Chryseosolibacter sp.]|nr:CHASE3 domain-containing protein [Chryseosolibacter sp.]